MKEDDASSTSPTLEGLQEELRAALDFFKCEECEKHAQKPCKNYLTRPFIRGCCNRMVCETCSKHVCPQCKKLGQGKGPNYTLGYAIHLLVQYEQVLGERLERYKATLNRKILCPYAEYGCSWTGPLSELPKHALDPYHRETHMAQVYKEEQEIQKKNYRCLEERYHMLLKDYNTTAFEKDILLNEMEGVVREMTTSIMGKQDETIESSCNNRGISEKMLVTPQRPHAVLISPEKTPEHSSPLTLPDHQRCGCIVQ